MLIVETSCILIISRNFLVVHVVICFKSILSSVCICFEYRVIIKKNCKKSQLQFLNFLCQLNFKTVWRRLEVLRTWIADVKRIWSMCDRLCSRQRSSFWLDSSRWCLIYTSWLLELYLPNISFRPALSFSCDYRLSLSLDRLLEALDWACGRVMHRCGWLILSREHVGDLRIG